MDPSELTAILKAAFLECDRKFCPLSDRQKELVLKTALDRLTPSELADYNPLEELSEAERTQLIAFIQTQDADEQSWKISLLNDWLNGRDSGAVQFIREKFGFNWLSCVQPIHLQPYLPEATPVLAVGDRIEVSSRLWEWTRDENSEDSEWVAAKVIGIGKGVDPESEFAIAIVQFTNGSKYEISGANEWNRYNWRYIEDKAEN
jgi:hypothetical protein